MQTSLTTGLRDEIVLILEGEIDLATADELRNVGGEALIANATADAHVELSRVTFPDSTGIGAWFISGTWLGRATSLSTILGASMSNLELTGLTETFRISSSG